MTETTQQLAVITPAAMAERVTPVGEAWRTAPTMTALRTEMISAQDDLDWDVYRRYGLALRHRGRRGRLRRRFS